MKKMVIIILALLICQQARSSIYTSSPVVLDIITLDSGSYSDNCMFDSIDATCEYIPQNGVGVPTVSYLLSFDSPANIKKSMVSAPTVWGAGRINGKIVYGTASVEIRFQTLNSFGGYDQWDGVSPVYNARGVQYDIYIYMDGTLVRANNSDGIPRELLAQKIPVELVVEQNGAESVFRGPIELNPQYAGSAGTTSLNLEMTPTINQFGAGQILVPYTLSWTGSGVAASDIAEFNKLPVQATATLVSGDEDVLWVYETSGRSVPMKRGIAHTIPVQYGSWRWKFETHSSSLYRDVTATVNIAVSVD
ncbi:hypothetical protein [Salmonella enterica]|uniref:hypothetical protein n=1 Tax=Salmonella enterica TaxID=28901 RepID=UPI0026DB689C|nr:hypothetical protein [Salmonella enterica]MDO3872087.1 hypothetical protein [Salmonella enterica]MDO3886851.1 hypothetical protein [Salmonella enterica]MDO3900044.1 hypothetical protein [Salmonella enterica]MDO3976212.1 hypothetical protein [Salmonella enterica]